MNTSKDEGEMVTTRKSGGLNMLKWFKKKSKGGDRSSRKETEEEEFTN